MQDKVLRCRDCGQDFTFTTAEQEDFRGRGLFHDPSRCQGCRDARKERRSGDPNHVANAPMTRNGRTLFKAQCAECGRDAMVPFQPRSERPVYCSDCFESRQGGFATSRR
jgi:CxxC-x17-CxxC domain-containing protein